MDIVFVGIGGTGLSAIASILHRLGYTNIIGIDSNESQITQNLRKQGIKIIIGHGIHKLNRDDYVIYSDAVLSNPTSELITAKRSGIKHVSYFEFIGEISKHFKTISIAGTHGKSTSTAMGIFALSNIKEFALGIVGALMPNMDNKNYYLNEELLPQIKNIFADIINGGTQKALKKYYFIIEADEFNKHFLHLQSEYAIITNMELDHSDVFQNIDEYYQSFKKFANNTKKKIFGLNTISCLTKLNTNKLKLINERKFNFKYVFGGHNKKNASLIYSLLAFVFPDKAPSIKKSLEEFPGIRRRMEFLYTNQNGAQVYSDYGHHPSELKAVLNAFRTNFPDKKLVCVFQPHQARRVLEFWDEFIKVVKGFDSRYIYDIYIARENLPDLKKIFVNKDFNDINEIKDLGEMFAEKCNGTYIQDFHQVTDIIKNAKSDEIVINFSAGNLDIQVRNLDK